MNKVVWDGFDCGWLAKHCSVYTYTPVQTHFQNHSPLFQTAQSSPKQGKDIHVRLYDKLHCPVTHTVLLCHNHFHLGRTMQRGDAMYCERDNDPATMDVYTVLYCIHPWWQDHCYMYVLRHSSVTCQISFYSPAQFSQECVRGFDIEDKDPTLGCVHLPFLRTIKCMRKNPTEYGWANVSGKISVVYV